MDTITITEDAQVAEVMSEAFASVGTTIGLRLHPANDNENAPLQQRFEKSFFFQGSTSECSKIITNLKNTKVDIDITPIKVLQKLSTTLLSHRLTSSISFLPNENRTSNHHI